MQSSLSTGSTKTSRWVYVATFAGPLVAAIVVITSSPNFERLPVDATRESPIGGDFLQEWIGGHVIASGMTDRLYDEPFTQELQHNQSLLGFRWAEKQYYPMVYPPFYYRLVSPLSQLSLPRAATLWCLLNALAFSLGLTWLAFELRHALRGGVWLVALGVLFHPLLLSLSMGQKSGMLLFLLAASYGLARQGRTFWSGVAFGCIVFKPHLALVLGPAMLLKRQYAFSIGALIPVGFAVASSLLMGLDVCGDFLEVCRGVGSYSAHAGYSLVDSHNVWGAAQYVFDDWATTLGKVVAWAAAAVVFGLLWWILRGDLKTQNDRFPLQYSALIVGTILLSPHFYTYDLSILLIPMALVGGFFARSIALARPGSSHPRLTRAPWHWAMIGILFCASGIFQALAETTGVPISVLFLVGWILLISRELHAMPPQADRLVDAGDERIADIGGARGTPLEVLDLNGR